MKSGPLNNEKELLEQLAQSDERALDVIYRHYWEWLFLCSFNILKDKQVCEDIIQDVFANLWTNREKLNISISLRAYLFASCRYALFKVIRKAKVHEDVFTGLADRLQANTTYGALEHKELMTKVNAIIEGLPPKCRDVYKLSRHEQLSHKEIAERLNISVKTAENHINRALRELKNSLSGLISLELLLFLLRK